MEGHWHWSLVKRLGHWIHQWDKNYKPPDSENHSLYLKLILKLVIFICKIKIRWFNRWIIFVELVSNQGHDQLVWYSKFLYIKVTTAKVTCERHVSRSLCKYQAFPTSDYFHRFFNSFNADKRWEKINFIHRSFCFEYVSI